jgi:tetratricopeptide (TPR) repeat protein
MELGLPIEAEEELAGLGGEAKKHPAALEIGWAAAAAQAHWDRAFVLGDRLVGLEPTLVSAWIHRAYAARRMPGGGLERALAALLPAANHFPEEPMVAYNLACYLVRLGRIEEGWRWYAEAEVRGDPANIRQQALKDDDLRELWGRIRELG